MINIKQLLIILCFCSLFTAMVLTRSTCKRNWWRDTPNPEISNSLMLKYIEDKP